MSRAHQIDEVDAKILKDLLKDGRKEFTQIANEAGVSKDIIWQHYTKMKKDGTIIGATIQLNYRALGYAFSTHFFVSVELPKQEEVVASMRKIPGIYDAYQCGCSSELWAVGTLKNTAELEFAKQAIKKLPGVLGLRTEIWTGVRNNPGNMSILCPEGGSERSVAIKKLDKKPKRMDFDSIDHQIIDKLTADGRASFNGIAKELKISTDTVVRRYKMLRENGILRPIIQLDPTKLGYIAESIISIAVASQDNIEKTIEAVGRMPDIRGIWKTVGLYDIDINCMVRNIQQLLSIHEKVSRLTDVVKMETALIRKTSLLPYPREHMSDF